MSATVKHVTLSERLASYACGLSYDDIPAAVLWMLKRVIVHDLTVALAGRRTNEVAQAVAMLDTDLAGRADNATVLGHRRRAAPADAAYANAVMMRTLRQEDTILPTGVHAGVIVIPAALAVGEQLGSSGRDVVTAMVAGYDVVGKLAAAHPATPDRAPRPSSHIYGAFGSAVVASRLMGFDEDQMVRALGWAGNLAAVVNDGFGNHQYGAVTRNGLTAAYLGQVRAPATPDALDGEPGFYQAQAGASPICLREHLGSLGKTWEVLASVLKPFPCMAFNAIPALLLRRLLSQQRLLASDIVHVEVRRSHPAPNAYTDSKGPWSGPFRTTSSLPFTLACIAHAGTVTPELLCRHDDPTMAAFARRVKIRYEPHTNPMYFCVTVFTTDGRQLSVDGDERAYEVPDPKAVLAMHNAPESDHNRVDRLAEIVADLENVDRLDDISACLYG